MLSLANLRNEDAELCLEPDLDAQRHPEVHCLQRCKLSEALRQAAPLVVVAPQFPERHEPSEDLRPAAKLVAVEEPFRERRELSEALRQAAQLVVAEE